MAAIDPRFAAAHYQDGRDLRGDTITDPQGYKIASPEALFEACLERAARGLCHARKIDPDALVPYDNGTMTYTQWPAWRSAAEELRNAWLVAMFVRTLP